MNSWSLKDILHNFFTTIIKVVIMMIMDTRFKMTRAMANPIAKLI
jgi:hypothetical protein